MASLEVQFYSKAPRKVSIQDSVDMSDGGGRPPQEPKCQVVLCEFAFKCFDCLDMADF